MTLLRNSIEIAPAEDNNGVVGILYRIISEPKSSQHNDIIDWRVILLSTHHENGLFSVEILYRNERQQQERVR